MKEYPNFYENLNEAWKRLRGTVVLYDGQPYYVQAITNHKSDGIFRMYLDPVGLGYETRQYAPDWGAYHYDHPGLGDYLDGYLDNILYKDKTHVLRKMMNSPKFNKFRPFPLGMCNQGLAASYLERMPTRHTQQGLTGQMIVDTPVLANTVKGGMPRGRFEMYDNPAFRDTVLGLYPSADEVITGLTDPDIMNDSVAFHRDFAIVRGPMQLLFLAYKHDVIGLLPQRNLRSVTVDKNFWYLAETINDLGVFADINK